MSMQKVKRLGVAGRLVRHSRLPKVTLKRLWFLVVRRQQADDESINVKNSRHSNKNSTKPPPTITAAAITLIPTATIPAPITAAHVWTREG
jgi:hypothetical protein